MKKLCFFMMVCIAAITSTAVAQTYEVPKNYTLKAKEDFAKYEQDVINTVDWLQQTPWGEQDAKVKQANTFLIAWVTGSPTVSLEVGNALMKLVDKNKGLLFTYIGGYTKYCIQNKDDKSKVTPNVAALRAMIAKYQMEPTHIKDDAMEKLAEIDKSGKLESWIATDFK